MKLVQKVVSLQKAKGKRFYNKASEGSPNFYFTNFSTLLKSKPAFATPTETNLS